MDPTIAVINFLAIFRPDLLDINILRDHAEAMFHFLEVEHLSNPQDPDAYAALLRAAEMLDTLNGVEVTTDSPSAA